MKNMLEQICIEYQIAGSINKLFNVELSFFSLLDKIILQSKLKMWSQILIAMQATEILLSASIKAGVSFQN